MSKSRILTRLDLSWSVSRGRDTYGYNICRLDDCTTGKRYRTSGGGYDMVGTVFGKWLAETFQDELKAHVKTLPMVDCGYQVSGYLKTEGLYGLNVTPRGDIQLDGACGMSSMETIARAIGLTVERTYNRKGHTTGFMVSRGYEDAH